MRKRFFSLLMAMLLIAGALPQVAAASAANPLDNWSARTSGTSGLIYDVAYGNGVYAAVVNTNFLSSADAVTWTDRGSAPDYMASVIYANSQFVAVGWSGKIATSPDGITWTTRTSGTTSVFRDVAYGNGLYVAVGENGAIYTSPDAVTWTSRTSNIPYNYLQRVAYGNGMYVAVGDGGKIVTSPDGVAWTLRTSNRTEQLFALAYGNGMFVLAGADELIMTSPDGVTWTVRNYAPSVFPLPSYEYFRAAYGNGMFVLVGQGGKIKSSIDGVTWTNRTSGITNNLWGVDYGGDNTFVAVGAQGKIIQSGTIQAITDAAVPSIGTQPGDQTVTQGAASPTLSVSATVSDGGTLSYQWYSNTTNSNSGGTLISSATSATYAAPTASAGVMYYYVVVTNTNNGVNGMQTAPAASHAAKVTVNALVDAAAPSLGTQPGDQTVTQGAASPTLSVSATVSDGGTLSYQWYSNTTNSNSGGTLISSATSATYAAPTASAGVMYYYVVVTNTNNGVNGMQTAPAASHAAKVTVNVLVHAAAPSIGTQPGDQTITQGAASPTLSVSATVSDGGTLSYQWYSNTTNSNSGGMLISSATSATYAAPTANTGTTYYYVVVTNTNVSVTGTQTATTTSAPAKVTVNTLVNAESPSISGQPSNQTANVGDTSPTLSVAATMSDGGTLSYQWYSNATNSNSGGTLISSATSATYAASTASAGTTYYYVVVTNTNGSVNGMQMATTTSSTAKMTVNLLVSFDSNGGSAVTSQTLSSNSTATKPTDPTRSGYTFSGWYRNIGLTNAFDFSTPITLNTALYAKWTVQPTGETGSPSSAPAENTSTTDGKLTLSAGKSGDVGLDDEVKIEIPIGATAKDLNITIQRLTDTKGLLTSKDIIASAVFEILKNFPENFSKDITLTFTFNSNALQKGQRPAVFYYDESKKTWVEVAGGNVNGNTISVRVNHFTKYAVFAVGGNASSAGETPQIVHFTDIAGHWAEASINQAASTGIVNGFPDGTFKPDNTVTRAEFAVMLMNALKPQEDGANLTFSDNAKIGAWAQKALAQAVYAGIMKGFDDETIRPDMAITRSEMAAMLARALGQSVETKTSTGFSDDKLIPIWAKGEVAAMEAQGIIKGKGDNAFAPNDKLTRAEAVAVMLRMLAIKDK
ncbi:S-layer homology domain-containing protein [Paenibacillus marchantiophytorum]|nr:S-layer homology domain-containing protein [Paenibacillus marchantiophytorum]